ncbi:MAG: coenzyme F420-0:L-glutamate ligase [Actinomycetota bacterium]|nr:coenzyme F420-0:L-glutamate ligase [Actinomycetota bacterium]
MPEIEPGDDLAALIVEAAGESGILPGDVVVVAQKAVSKSEGRVVLSDDRLSMALEESARVLRRSGDTVISETRHGFVCANAGVDSSNVEPGKVALLPLDPDLSARRIWARIKSLTGADVGVIVSDTFGRAWRIGQTNVAIGVAGIDPFADYRGLVDGHGNELTATRICLVDEIAGAAELIMGKTSAICAAIIRGAPVDRADASAAEIVRPAKEDLFR